jgi:hypothetical protein
MNIKMEFNETDEMLMKKAGFTNSAIENVKNILSDYLKQINDILNLAFIDLSTNKDADVDKYLNDMDKVVSKFTDKASNIIINSTM